MTQQGTSASGASQCPECGGRGFKVMFGEPQPDDIQNGIYRAGCTVPLDPPEYRCIRCNHGWGHHRFSKLHDGDNAELAEASRRRMRSVLFRLFVILAVVAISVPIVIRYGMVRFMTSGGGSYVASPDGRLEASASSLRAQRFWGGERRWIEYEIVEEASGDAVFSANYAVPGDCRAGDVTWEVRNPTPTSEQRERLEREAELLGEAEPSRLPPVHVVTFDCGSVLTLTSTNAIDFFVCETCLPRVDRGDEQVEAEE